MRSSLRIKLMLTAGLTLSLMNVIPLEGQRGRRGGRRPPPPAESQRLEQRVRVRMNQMVRERLDLTQEEWEAIKDHIQDFGQKRRELMQKERVLQRRVEAVALDENNEESSNILEELIALREQELELFREEQEELLGVLSPSQLLRFQNIREQLGEQIRRLRGGRQSFRPGGGDFDARNLFWNRESDALRGRA